MATIDFAENSRRQRARYYRRDAEQLRSMAKAELLPARRQRLVLLAQEYEDLADQAELLSHREQPE